MERTARDQGPAGMSRKVCRLCRAVFSDAAAMKRHEEWHDPRSPFVTTNRILNRSGVDIWEDA